MAERVAALEAVIPRIDESIRDLNRKTDRVLERLEQNLATKADKDELEAVKSRVDEVQKKVWIWSGAVLVLSTIVGWFGKDIFIK